MPFWRKRMYAVQSRYPRNRDKPMQLRDSERDLYLRGSGYRDAVDRWMNYELQVLARHGISPEVIAMFERRLAADRYAARHDSDGDGKLTVIESQSATPLRYEVHTTVDGESVPLGVSFRYLSEASAYSSRHNGTVRDTMVPARDLKLAQ